MADQKATALSAFTPVLTDILYGVDDPGGTPVSGKVTLTAVRNLLQANFTALTVSNGSASSPALHGSDADSGVFFSGNNTRIAVGGSTDYVFGSQFLNFRAVGGIQWSESGDATGTADLRLSRDGTDTLALRRGENEQSLNVYSRHGSSTDYHRLGIKATKATASAVSGASVTLSSLIPDGAVVVGVTTKVTTGLGTGNGTTGYQVGDGTDADRWGAVTGTAAGTTSDNTDWTAGTVECFTSANDVVLTAVGGNFDGTGEIDVSVQYLIGQSD